MTTRPVSGQNRSAGSVRADPVMRKRPGRRSASMVRLTAPSTSGTICHSSSSTGSARPRSAASGLARNAAASSESKRTALLTRRRAVVALVVECCPGSEVVVHRHAGVAISLSHLPLCYAVWSVAAVVLLGLTVDLDDTLGPRGTAMKTMTVDDGLYGALEAAADRNGRPIQELVNEAIASWLADAAADEDDRAAIEHARAEAAGHGGVEFEPFFDVFFCFLGIRPDCRLVSR